MDVYTPPGLRPAEQRPAVLFVHGGPLAPGMSPKDWGGYLSCGRLAAASELVGIISDEARRELSRRRSRQRANAPCPRCSWLAPAGITQDNPLLNATVDAFLREAFSAGLPLELLNHPASRHGFDVLDDDARSKEIIARTIEFLKTHLR